MAWHLKRWLGKYYEVKNVMPRSLDNLPSDADIYLLAVSDDAIRSVALAIADRKLKDDAIIAHTSGSTSLDVLKEFCLIRGVWYPMQTFTKGKEIEDYRNIPVFIEGSDSKVSNDLREMALVVADNVKELDSQGRAVLHLAAVFACNYTGYMWVCAEKILKQRGLDFSLFQPLVEETFKKFFSMSPKLALTGPARRADMVTIEKQISSLNKDEDMQQLYTAIAKSIINDYK